MKRIAALAGLASLIIVGGAAAQPTPANIAAAVANPDRPDADRVRDADRKPAEDLAFAGVKPGEKVADLIAATGYFSRIFSTAVGPTGHVYAFYPSELKNFRPQALPADGAVIFPNFPNVTAVVTPVNAFAAPEPLDMVWISDNYHDLHDPFFKPADLAIINKAVFQALKPGGIYIVLDYQAQPGSGLRDTNTLHRIDPESVKAEVEAAGFKLVGESDVLHNPDDPHTAPIFAAPLKGRVDQFILKFRKPRS
jgi:predicted methyltransferase